MKIAIVTGGSNGIGKATAEAFAQVDINLILCGRRQDRLDELARQLSAVQGTLEGLLVDRPRRNLIRPPRGGEVST